jgi:hypothetical protein
MIATPERCLDATRRLGLDLPPNPHSEAAHHQKKWEQARAIDATLGLVGEAYVALESAATGCSEKAIGRRTLSHEALETRDSKLKHIEFECVVMSAISQIDAEVGIVGAAALGLLHASFVNEDIRLTLSGLNHLTGIIEEDKGAAQIFTTYTNVFMRRPSAIPLPAASPVPRQ